MGGGRSPFLPHALALHRDARGAGAPVSKAALVKLVGACLRDDPPAAEALLREMGVDAALDVVNNLARQAQQQQEAASDPRGDRAARAEQGRWLDSEREPGG